MVRTCGKACPPSIVVFVVLVLLVVTASPSAAQSSAARVLLTVAESSSDGAAAEVTFTPLPDATVSAAAAAPSGSAEGGRRARVVTVGPAGFASLELEPGRYAVRASRHGSQTEDVPITVDAAVYHVLEVRVSGTGTAQGPAVAVRSRTPTAHQVAWTRERLDALPGARTTWALGDLAHPFLVSDRTDAGGLTGSDPVRVSGYGSAASQVTYRWGDLDITDPASGGVPLVLPTTDGASAVVATAAARGVEVEGPGPEWTVIPRPAGDRWSGTASAALTPSGWQSTRETVAPRLTRGDGWSDAAATMGGRVGARGSGVGLTVSARTLRARWRDREAPLVLGSDTTVVASQLAVSRQPGRLGLSLLASRDRRPYDAGARFADRARDDARRALLLGGSWRGGTGWDLGAMYARWSSAPDVPADAAGGIVERLRDGPPRGLLDAGAVDASRVEVRAARSAAPRRAVGLLHDVSAGAQLSRAGTEIAPIAQPAFLELVNGAPARLWDVRRRGTSLRRGTAAGVYASDRMTAGALSLRAGLRLDLDRASADGSASRIRWATWSPRMDVRWHPVPSSGFTVVGAYGRYAHRLTLDTLAAGDPNGAAGTMSRWDDVNRDRRASPGELTPVAAIGSARDAIDNDLVRPTTREFVIGAEQQAGRWRWRITGVDRRESRQLIAVDAGLTPTDFEYRTVPDPGIDLNATPAPLAIASRRASSALRDVMRLTNATGPAYRYQGFEIDLDARFGRWFWAFGGLTHRAEAPGASRGYRADENDQGRLGEVALDPNAGQYATGRLFFDRAYIIKTSIDYTAPRDVRLGVAARYMDGQPFARVIVASGLGQGTDIVAAYPRGGQRFTYVLTVDGRAEKRFAVRGVTFAVVGEVFNLLDLAHEVEEDIVTGAAFRTITAVQPPRSARIGVRVEF